MRNNGCRILQVVLFVAGAVLLPLGLFVIVLGWYGAAHTPGAYDQLSYLVSFGLLGLGLTFCGGLPLLRGLARPDRRRPAGVRQAPVRHPLVLADVVSLSAAGATATVAAPAAERDPGAVLVVAGQGTTVHRGDFH